MKDEGIFVRMTDVVDVCGWDGGKERKRRLEKRGGGDLCMARGAPRSTSLPQITANQNWAPLDRSPPSPGAFIYLIDH